MIVSFVFQFVVLIKVYITIAQNLLSYIVWIIIVVDIYESSVIRV